MMIARRVQATRMYLASAALLGAAFVFLALFDLHPVYGVGLASAATAIVLWWWRGVFSRHRVALWLEERRPELRYALIALEDDPSTRFRERLEARADAAKFARPLLIAGLRLVGIPLGLLLAMQLIVRPLMARTELGARILGAPPPTGVVGTTTTRRFAAVVTSPAYSRVAQKTIQNPASVVALVGSDLRFEGRWNAHAVMPHKATVLRLENANGQRLVALEPRPDSAPRVVLDLPARDTVMKLAHGTMPLSASARDDIGLVSVWFEIIISSGGGERFTFRSATLGRTNANGARALDLKTALALDSLSLEPGDIVHLRAVARDGNPASDAVAGSSETRTLRVYRSGEADSVAVEAAPPPEVGKSELSQRMLIMLTEKLVAQSRSLGRPTVKTESEKIASDQSKLRKRVGQIIFTRITGEESSDESIGAVLADTLSPADALLKAASDATGSGVESPLEDEENDAPVVAVNRPLLEAFNAMWEAERKLGIGEPKDALPFMRAALAAIERARAAERLYLRGRPPKVVLDIARIRLTGKKEGIDPTGRTPRSSAIAATIAREERFHRALELLAQDAAAAIDTLTLLRVDALDTPPLAAALDAALTDLRSGRNATTSLGAVHRQFAGATQARGNARWSGAW